jgi:uncharacterized membrane protein YraQ (UPF0718 family)
VSLQKQGANTGATTAFLISTPESGVDSIAITYALLDPIMTVARPVAAFITAAAAGISENLFGRFEEGTAKPDRSCPIDGCCNDEDCPPEVHRHHHTFSERVRFGFRFARHEVWKDISGWFFLGLIIAGFITSLIPDTLIQKYVGGGLSAMLMMLIVGIPLYICASASTPIAAALILKGVSPGAALVFLLAGPATNVTSITVLLGMLGRRATVLYFAAIALCTVLCGLAVDKVYALWGVSAAATIGQASEIIPVWVKVAGAVVLILFSIHPVLQQLKRWMSKKKHGSSPMNGTPFPMEPSSSSPSCTEPDCTTNS